MKPLDCKLEAPLTMQDHRARPHFHHRRGIFNCITLIFILLNHVSPILCSSPFVDQVQVRYWELQRLNVSNYPRDSCRENRTLDNSFADNNCLCDKTCATYDVCCLDSKYRFYRPIGRSHSTCTYASSNDLRFGFLMVDQCRSDYTGDAHISELCSGKARELNDPMLQAHVTNTKTGITYLNYFCAVCNDDVRRHHNVFWAVRLTSWVKNISQSELIDLKYDPEMYSWVLPNSNGTEVDRIRVEIIPPSYLREDLKRCHFSITSDCVDGWPDDDIRRKCAAYMAIVLIPDGNGTCTRFRNIHCALCNGAVGSKGLGCKITGGYGGGGYGTGRLSFALLLDINRSDGDKVGRIQRCSDNEIYDPFFKRCRVLKCALPGYAIKNGNCARQ